MEAPSSKKTRWQWNSFGEGFLISWWTRTTWKAWGWWTRMVEVHSALAWLNWKRGRFPWTHVLPFCILYLAMWDSQGKMTTSVKILVRCRTKAYANYVGPANNCPSKLDNRDALVM